MMGIISSHSSPALLSIVAEGFRERQRSLDIFHDGSGKFLTEAYVKPQKRLNVRLQDALDEIFLLNGTSCVYIFFEGPPDV